MNTLKKAEAGVNKVATTVNLCNEGFNLSEELLVNYTDLGRQIMILDIGAPVSLAGTAWMTQYLKEFDLTIEEMKSIECEQVFRFGPSKRYVSQTMIELLVLVTMRDSRQDVLKVQTYLVEAEVPFLCGKHTLELWNFKIDGRKKVLKLKIDGERKEYDMVDTLGSHYGIVLET